MIGYSPERNTEEQNTSQALPAALPLPDPPPPGEGTGFGLTRKAGIENYKQWPRVPPFAKEGQGGFASEV
jgi:hypothetical protein